MPLTKNIRVSDDLATSEVANTPRILRDKLAETISIMDFAGASGDGVTANDTAFQAACARLNGKGKLLFPLHGGTVYRFAGTFPASITAGIEIEVEKGVELSMPDIGYFHATTTFTNTFRMILWAIKSDVVVPQSAKRKDADRKIYFSAKDRDQTVLRWLKPNAGDLTYFTYDQRNDVRTAATPTATSDKGVAFHNTDLYLVQAGMISVETGDELTFIGAGADLASVSVMGMVQCRGSRYWLYGGSQDQSLVITAKSNGGSPVATPVNYQGQGTHSSYWMYRSNITLRKNSLRSFTLMLNGFAVKTVDTDSDIIEFGCGIQGIGNLTISNPVKRSKVPMVAGQFWSVAVFGDSLSADSMEYPWPRVLRDNLDGSCGIRIANLDNYAIAGASSGGQRSVMDGVNLGNYNVTVMLLGTNDIQGGVAVSTYLANMKYMMDNALNNGNMLVLGVPPLWYTQGQAGDHGQASSNYDQGKEYRSGLIQLVASYGPSTRIRLVELSTPIGVILGDFVNPSLNPGLASQQLDPTMYDNIHPTPSARYIMAKAFGEAFLELSTPDAPSDSYLPVGLTNADAKNGWTVDTDLSFFKRLKEGMVHIEVLFNNTPSTVPVDGTIIYQLPPEMRPVKTQRVLCWADNYTAKILVDTSGNVSVYGMAGGTWVHASFMYLGLN